MILLFGCLRRLVSLVILVAIGLAVWHYWPTIQAKYRQFRGQPVTAAVSPEEAARTANAKLRALESGSPPARTALSEDELQALLRTRLQGVLPRWVDSARIRLEGDRVRLSGRVPVDRMPQIRSLGEVAGLLPDTTEVAVSGQVIPLEEGRVALAVDQVTAAHIPLPRRLIPAITGGLRHGRPGIPADALPLPLPSNITSAYVRGDSLILLSSGARARPRAQTAPQGR